MIALIEWLKRLIAAIAAWFAGLDSASGLAIPWHIATDPASPPGWLRVPLDVAPDPPRPGDAPWLKIPLEIE